MEQELLDVEQERLEVVLELLDVEVLTDSGAMASLVET